MSLLRPKACLLATRSSREMKCTGTPKKVLATLFPRIRKLDACDFGQNVDPHRSNSNLINHLLAGECLRCDPIMVEGSANFLSAPTTLGEVCGELCTHTS